MKYRKRLYLACFKSASRYDMRARLLFSVFFILLSSTQFSAQTHDSLYTGGTSGPYTVGFKSETTYDYSRTAITGAERGRAIQVSIWYPVKATAVQSRMKIADYLRTAYSNNSPRSTAKIIDTGLIQQWKKQFPFTGKERLRPEEIFAQRTLAVKNGPMLEGAFPLILYGPGADGEAFDNFILCEYLASYGYIVAASPSMGLWSRAMTIDAVGLETQTRDLELILQHLNHSLGGDGRRIGVMGYSWGGLAAMLLQMRNRDIVAVLSIDGSIASHEDKARQSPFFNMAELRVPYMLFAAKDTMERHDRFFSRLKYSTAFLLRFSQMNHGDFNSLTFVANSFQPPESQLDVTSRKDGYALMCHYALNFFDGFLKGRQESARALRQPPAHLNEFVSVAVMEALPQPPRQDEFFAIILKEGIAMAHKIYRDVKSRDPEYVMFDEFGLAQIAFRVFDSGRKDEGIEVLKLDLEEYPQSYKPHGYIGSLYEEKGSIDDALLHYEKAYEMAAKDKTFDPVQVRNDLSLFQSLIEKMRRVKQRQE